MKNIKILASTGFILLLIFTLVPMSGFAAPLTKANTTTMNAAADWNPAQVPTNNDIGTFDSTISFFNIGSLALGGNVNIGGLVFANTLQGNADIGAGNTLTLGTSGIDMSAANRNVAISCAITLGGSQTFNVAAGRTLVLFGAINNGGNTLIITGAGDTEIGGLGGITGAGGLTKSGTGILTLSVANTYTGPTTINAGTLFLLSSNVIADTSALTVTAPGILNLNGKNETVGSLAGSGTVTTGGGASTLTAGGDNTSTIFTGIIQDGGGTVAFTKAGNGTLTISGNSTHTGATTINAGTLALGGNFAVGGNLTQAGTSTLSLGANTLTLNGIGVYSLAAGQTLNLNITNSSTFGNIQAVGGNSGITGGTVNVTVDNQYIPNGTTFTIVNNGGGATVVPTINTLGNARITLTGANSGGDLVLTVSRSGTGFASLATNANAQNAATVLDDVTNPSGDMTTVLTTLNGLGDAATGAALNTVVPSADSGTLDTTNSSLNNFVGASLERVHTVLNSASTETSATGTSTGDESCLNSVWGKGYGSYLNQGLRKGIEGYNAWNAGTAIGVDRMFGDSLTAGISGGYAFGHVNSNVNNAMTDIDSAQTTLYAGYQNTDHPFFIDGAFSFAWNWYEGNRDINIGAINRTADANYEGQQYGLYLDGGYEFKLDKNIRLTPLASIRWNRLDLNSYDETNAGAMSLSVNSQSYDVVQSGLGASLSSDFKYEWGTFTPEFHAKWLYNIINDNVALTSVFTGGGGSFATNGVRPAPHGANLGSALTFDFNNNLSLIAAFDSELRDSFAGVFGSATLRYKF